MSKLGATCVICDSSENASCKTDKGHEKSQQQITLDKTNGRHQHPLCRFHHNGLHNDTWTNEEKAIFSYETK